MPLIKSASDKARSANIAAEIRAGKPPKQAAAIAYRVQRDARRKKMARGGKVMGYAPGGSIPFQMRPQARQLERAGMINSPVAGRTDKLPMGVKPGSYVFPADTVSAIGQGNSMAGANALNRLFKMGPYGTAAGPAPRRMGRFADGGMAMGAEPPAAPPVDIVAAGGEYVLPPEKVAEVGGGDLKRGQDILDAMVAQTRKKAIRTLKRLPKPRKR